MIVETREVENKVIEEMSKKVVEEMMEEMMMEEEVVVDKGQNTVMAVEKRVALVVWNYKGSVSGSRKKVMEEKVEDIEEIVMPKTVQAREIQSQSPQALTYYYFFPTKDSVPELSLGEVEEIRVETKEVKKKVFEDMPKKR